MQKPGTGGKRVRAFIQARATSKRFPGKIYEEIEGVTILQCCINAIKKSSLCEDVIVISPHALKIPEGTKAFVLNRDENDVLSRYAMALEEFPCDYLVRITADCPLLDPFLVDYVIAKSIGYDYGSNVLVCTFPDGVDTEVISADTLRMVNAQATSKKDREHVTTYIRDNQSVQKQLSIVDVQSLMDYSPIKISIDTPEDLAFAKVFAEKIK